MARQQRVLETVTCDVCGKELDDAVTVVLGWGNDQWELDLCDADNDKIGTTFDSWIQSGRKVRSTRARSTTAAKASASTAGSRSSDWDYLESLGYKRHRGRKTTAEQEALANRPG